MIVAFLVLAGVGWLVIALISEQQRGEAVPITSRIASWGDGIARAGHTAVARCRRAWVERRSRARSTDLSFGVPAAPRRPRASGDGWRSRLVALLELILFVMLIGALFAGAMAAAAMRISHFGT